MSEQARTPGKQLARRAHALERGRVTEYLSFRLGEELYGVPLVNVREILTPPAITFVPRAPHDVMGIISVRGLLVTVIDLRVRMGVAPSTGGRRARVLLVPSPWGEMLGLYVDEVMQVYRLAEGEIEALGTVLGGNVAEHVTGVGRRDGDLIILLTLEPLLRGRA